MRFKDGIKEKNIIVKCGADTYLPFALTFGIYIILFGTISPGGGFQGGVIVASGVLLLHLAYGYREARKAVHPEFLRVGEAAGATLYVVLALLGIFFGLNFCRNVFFANGQVGDLISAGTITYMGYTVGFKVLTGVGFLLVLMLGLMAPEQEAREKKAAAHEKAYQARLEAEAAAAAAAKEEAEARAAAEAAAKAETEARAAEEAMAKAEAEAAKTEETQKPADEVKKEDEK